jgi:hypothetical protein
MTDTKPTSRIANIGTGVIGASRTCPFWITAGLLACSISLHKPGKGHRQGKFSTLRP